MNCRMGKAGGKGCRAEGDKGEKKWDNCNSIINKIYVKNKNKSIKSFFNVRKLQIKEKLPNLVKKIIKTP